LWFQILKNTIKGLHLKESSTVELKVENENSAVVPKRNLKNLLEGTHKRSYSRRLNKEFGLENLKSKAYS
jgi:antitoxin component of MazEF toxin-antitoxin module